MRIIHRIIRFVSAEDRKVVDSWKELVNKYLGDVKLTKINVMLADMSQFIEQETSKLAAEEEKISAEIEQRKNNIEMVNLYALKPCVKEAKA